MKFRTPLAPIDTSNKIDLAQPLLAIGSCFAESIGDKLNDNKFDALINPFGTIFDPLSITRLLNRSLDDKTPDPETYILSQGVYKNLELHSSFAGLSQDELELQIRARLLITGKFLRTAKWLIVTFGTAYVYRYKKTANYIANCQKLPAKEFSKELLTVENMKDDFTRFLHKLNTFNPSINIILTVSPVRHLKDGIAENSLNKSLLRLLCHELADDNDTIIYYPAYELMMDDLRDYRFYKKDMIHPSEQAVDYIWEHFTKSLMNSETLSFLDKWDGISNALKHKAFNPHTADHQNFLVKILQELESLQPQINTDKEVAVVKEQIESIVL
jgi:GSCFA family protein